MEMAISLTIARTAIGSVAEMIAPNRRAMSNGNPTTNEPNSL